MQDTVKVEKSMFEFVNADKSIHDTKIETKKIGYFKDAFIRFRKNKASVVAFIIICILILYAIFVPILAGNDYTKGNFDKNRQYYNRILPKISWLEGTGFWDGTKAMQINQNTYAKYYAMYLETGQNPIAKLESWEYIYNAQGQRVVAYNIRYDSYYGLGMLFLDVDDATYEKMEQWEEETGIQLLYPVVNIDTNVNSFKEDANIYYKIDRLGNPLVEEYDENNQPIIQTSYLLNADGSYRYKKASGTANWQVRVSKYAYFQYCYGEEPSFVFGTDSSGYDIFTRLAIAARFSFMLAIGVSAVNLVIGAIYGAIEGFYGGKIDLIMERICDILGNVPFMVVTTLFQLHLAKKVGVVPALLLAFFITGWIGTAATTRMQFYRYKNQEYVLAARTLGASNKRLMFKHIFPNALGTLITSSVLVIPSVIFSESSLTYLGIVNLDSSSLTSVGTMLANGKNILSTYPHVILFPALFISLLMITFNLFGNGLRDAFNPSLRGADD